MRWSFLGSTASFGSVHSVILPSPFVSSTAGHHPCDAAASWVLSNVAVSTQPMALFWPKTSESFSSNLLWSAAKQVSTIVNCFVFGSYISTCLALGPGSGKYFEYLFDPSLQNAGCCCGARVRAVSHTRPWLSIAALRGSACRCQIFSVPQYGESGVLSSITGPFEGILIIEVSFFFGSSTARMSDP